MKNLPELVLDDMQHHHATNALEASARAARTGSEEHARTASTTHVTWGHVPAHHR